jgi:hypothetical protein
LHEVVELALLDGRKALDTTNVKTNAAKRNSLFTLEDSFMGPPAFVAQ